MADQKSRPVPVQPPEPKRPLTVKDHALAVLDHDLLEIAGKDDEDIYMCLLIQACRGGNKSVNSILASARAIS